MTPLFIDLEENTPLHVAAAEGCVDLVKSLLKNGANTEATNILGWTPLMQAARYGCKDVVAILLKNKVAINTRNKFGLNALVLAVASGSIETVRLLIDNGASYNYELDLLVCQVSPLMVAALFSRNVIMRLFLDRGMSANISVPECDISTLMVAASSGCQSTLKMLIERGAKSNSINACNYSAIDVALFCNDKENVDYLKDCALTLRKKDKTDCNIMEVIRQGDLSMLQDILLCDSTKAMMTITAEGATPLMIAAMMNHISMADLLLHYGADINAQDYENGWTPLMQATYHKHSSMARLLMNWGADVSIKANQGYTVFDLANEVMDTDILKVFADRRINEMMSSNSVVVGNNGNSKQEIEATSTLQSFKLLFSKLVKKGSPSTPESMPRIPGNERRTSLTPLTVTFKSIYPDIPEENNTFYTNIFANEGKEEEKIMASMRPPSFDDDTKTLIREMPAGLTVRGNSKYYSNEHLRRYNDREAKLRAGIPSKHHPIPKIKVSKPQETEKPQEAELYSYAECSTTPTEGVNGNEVPFSGYDDLSDILRKCQLRSRENVFREEEVDSQAFMMLSPEDFSNLGISGTQRIDNIMKARQNLHIKRKN